jgi:hypothetical protein
MENIASKKDWLKKEYTQRLTELAPNAERLWGKMNVQQMIEHMADYVRIANGRTPMEVITPEEHLERTQAFLQSEKPFKENTPNSLMSDTPPPVRHTEIKEAITELQEELDHLFEVFDNNAELKIANPFFGHLDLDMQVQLLHKHAWHHLRQFGINE